MVREGDKGKEDAGNQQTSRDTVKGELETQ